VTETSRALRRLGRPHARVRATAVLLGGVGVALGAAAAGVGLAPHVAGVVGAWIVIIAALLVTWRAARAAAHTTAALPLARATEGVAGARAGSLATLLAAPSGAGASTALFDIADRRAADVVDRAAPSMSRVLARTSAGGLAAGVVLAILGAAVFVAAAPGAGRAEGFWRPWRAIALSRAPLALAVDHPRVRRGDAVTATVTVPGGAGGRVTLWTRGPGEPWRPAVLPLDSAGRGARRLGPLDSDLWLRASSGARRSPVLHVAVALPAFLADLSVVARFPSYLNRADEPLALGPDTVDLPAGTELDTRGTTSVALRGAGWQAERSRDGAVAPLTVDGTRFGGRFTPAHSGVWRIALAAADGQPLEGETPGLALRLVADSAPVVTVPVPGRDTTLPFSLVQPLVIDARDDHGVGRLALLSWRVSQTGKLGEVVRESLDASGVGDRAIVQGTLDAQRRGLLPGDTLRFRVEVWDNAPTPHLGRSPEYALRLPTREELRAAQRAATADIAAAAESVSAAERSLADRTRDLAQERSRGADDASSGRQPSGQTGALPFQASERAQEIARQQEAVGERVRELSKAVDDLARAARAAGIDDTAFQSRLREVQEMLGRAMTPELEQRLRDLQAALARLDPEATRDALRRLAEAQQELRETLERSEQLFRRAAVEGQLASLAQDADALRRDQAAWNRDAARRADSAAAAAERELAARADSLSSGIAQADRDLAATRQSSADSGGVLAGPHDQARLAQGAMQQAATSAERADAGGAESSGSEALRHLDSLPQSLRARRDSVTGQWRRETLDALDRALAETAALAERQRRVARDLESGGSPAAARSQQAAIEEGAAAIERQVRDAAGRHALVSPGLQSALGFAERQMRAAREQLEQAQPNSDGAAQMAGEALDALNVTAYALAQSRADVAGAQSGSGFQEAVEKLAQMASQQQGLNQESMGMMPMAGSGADGMLQQLRSLAARQRALAEQLERLQATGGSGAAGPLAQEARDLAHQLDAGHLDRQTIERQERLYRRLLDAGRTLTGPEPDQDKERTSQSAVGDSVHLPALLAPGVTAGPRVRYPTWRDLESLTPEQRRLVLEYFRILNAPK
jgi:hypothetical protein